MCDEGEESFEEEILKDGGVPEPIVVPREKRLSNIPSFYGEEFHGVLHYPQAKEILGLHGEGAYLIRLSSAAYYILSVLFDNNIHNFETSYDGLYWNGKHHFDNVKAMVKDSLETKYLEKYGNSPTDGPGGGGVEEEIKWRRHSKMIAEKVQADFQAPPRAHHFNAYYFKVPRNCGFCHDLIWGPIQERLKCMDCGYAIHRGCEQNFVHDCQPSLRYVKGVFGVDLSAYCMAHAIHVPTVLVKCYKEIEDRGLHEEGIFRVSGSVAHIDELKNQFDAGIDVNLSAVGDIHIVCGLLKLYLKSVPMKLLPFVLFLNMVNFFISEPPKPEEEIFEFCRKELSELDPYRAMTLSSLFGHLRKVIEFSDENLMKAHNLATVFCPTLLHVSLPHPSFIQVLSYVITTPTLLTPPNSN